MGQLKETIDNKNFVEYIDGRTSLVSGANSVSATEENGVFINGSLSISAKPTNIRMGGIYTFHPLALSGIPSTSISPIPTFRINIPVKGLKTATSIVQGLRGL